MLNIILVSLFASVAFASLDECYNVRKTCEPEDDYVKNITTPGNAEELEAYCNYGTNYYGCLYEKLLECKYFGAAKIYAQKIEVIEHICNKDTDLYHNLIIILPCIKNVTENERDECYEMYSNELIRKKFENILANNGITDLGNEHYCVYDYFFDACAIGENGAMCGVLGRKVSLEITQLFAADNDDFCTVQIREKMPEISLEMEVLYIEEKDKILKK